MMLERPPSQAKPLSKPARRRALRRHAQARYRANQKAGRMSIVITVDDELIDFLTRTRWLEQKDVFDRAEIAAAIEALLADAAQR
jgi:hypothetical protein